MLADRSTRGRAALVLGSAVVAVVIGVSLLTLSHQEPYIRADRFPPVSTASSADPGGFARPAVSGSSITTEETDGRGDGLSPLPALTSLVATARAGVASLDLYPTARATDADGSIPGAGDYGQRQVFLVIDQQSDRLHVRLPVRPNGSTGWIEVDDVELTEHDYQIQVALGAHQLLLQHGDDVLIDTPIAVGTADTPTVGGDFYSWVLIDPTNAGYGSYAYGLSGFSTLEEFNGGDGRMAIHGTTDESGIGGDVSHGCIRIPDAIAVEMVEQLKLPLGIPVTIRP